jgi:uncharacterized protein (TIGR02145 family)
MKNKIWHYPLLVIGLLMLLTNSCKKDDENKSTSDQTPTLPTVTDIDGNVYHIITIGTQQWMVENLNTTKYRNGDPIPNISDSSDWHNLITGAYCNYANSATNSTTYGKLYNWYSVNDIRNLAPVGWHVPTDSEWTVLSTYVGGISVAGGKLKESGTSHWASPNTGATNSVGFLALPGGYRSSYSIFSTIGNDGYWWSATESYLSNSFFRNIDYNYSILIRNTDSKACGFSVRCVKD